MHATPPPESNIEQSASAGLPVDQDNLTVDPVGHESLKAMQDARAAGSPAAVVRETPVSALSRCAAMAHANEIADSAVEDSHYALDSSNSGISNNSEDARPRRGPSAKKKLTVEEYKRSRQVSPRCLKYPPPPLASRQSTPPYPDWNRPEPQYDKFGVQIFDAWNNIRRGG